MNHKLKIQNLKCHGCAHTVTESIKSVDGVSDVTVDVEQDTVSFNTENIEAVERVKKDLLKLGYPEVGESNTILSKAKSYVSCASGRMKA